MGKTVANDQQKLVLNHAGGPLLVVAGAGTGKTFVIIEKIKKLLDEGIDPKSILAVTFTEKAASEMLDRLLANHQGTATEIPIMTFNAFGESILREFSSHIGLGRNFRLLGEQAQLVFVRERIDEFKLDYFLPLSTLPDSVLGDLLGHFSSLKQHLVTPKKYLEFVETLPVNDDAARYEKKQFEELARAYQTYIRLTRAENVIDYDDQIFLCIELMEKRPNVGRTLQERFHSLFIDEFQDTSPMQSRLVDMLAGDTKNLVVVGDDDQSIYGFRGATLANILEFKDRYPDAKSIALTENYRSGQAILDAAYSLIQNNNPHRLESTLRINKRLIAASAGSPPTLKKFAFLGHELAWIVQDISARLSSGQSAGQIAVLARRRITAKQISEALEQAGIEHRLVGYSQNLYATGIVRTIIELCRTITEPGNNNSLHHTLTGELFNISNEAIAPYAVKARYEHESLEEVLLSSDHSQDFEPAIEVIRRIRQSASTLSVGRLLYRFLDESGYKDRLYGLAEQGSDEAQKVQHLAQFFEVLRDFESIAIQPTAVQFMSALPALQAAGEQTEDGTLDIGLDEVCVMTVHKSKGLEWDVVYIPDCTENSFPTRKSSKPLPIPESLKATSASEADDHYAEERRLMYVAVTRAKKDLVLSFSERHKPTSSPRKPSRFLTEMFGEAADKLIQDDGVPPGQTSLPLAADGLKPALKIPAEILDSQKVYLTVSQAATLLNCPRDFYYKYVLRAPQDPSPSTAYGIVIHGLIESINKSRIAGEKLSLADLQNELKSSWTRSGYASKALAERAFLQANLTITNFYERSQSEPPPLHVEMPFSAELNPENLVLRGRFDVVFGDESGVEIRDYKTSLSVNSTDKAKRRASASTQLTMYALAWQAAHGELPSKMSLDFVDTGLVGSVRKTERGIISLRTKLGEAADLIRRGEFPLGDKHDYCIHPISNS